MTFISYMQRETKYRKSWSLNATGLLVLVLVGGVLRALWTCVQTFLGLGHFLGTFSDLILTTSLPTPTIPGQGERPYPIDDLAHISTFAGKASI